MGIVSRVNRFDHEPPIRAYIHSAGLVEEYGSVENAKDYLNQLMDEVKGDPEARAFQWLISILWADTETNEKMIDCFGYYAIKQWPGNPGVHGWVMRNGIYQSDEDTTCGDGLIILGKEEEYRRRTKNLEEYLQKPPLIMMDCAD